MQMAPTIVIAASFEAIERFENRLSSLVIIIHPVGAPRRTGDACDS
jgi:hypothetical protein